MLEKTKKVFKVIGAFFAVIFLSVSIVFLRSYINRRRGSADTSGNPDIEGHIESVSDGIGNVSEGLGSISERLGECQERLQRAENILREAIKRRKDKNSSSTVI